MRGLEQIPWLYDPVCALYELLGLDRWRRWLVAGARGLALDVGCGTGRNLPLYREGVRVVGLDPAVEGPGAGQDRAVLGLALRRLPPEPRHRARRRGVGVRHRSGRTTGQG